MVILVVDDDCSVRTLLREILQSLGYEVLEAGSAERAVILHSECGDSIDLVITDLIMPSKTGIDLIMELIEKDDRVKILAMTGGGYVPGTTNYLPLANLLGAIKTIRKPFSASSISNVVKSILT